jgi:hypothetical protein
MREAKEILKIAKELLALDNSREGNILAYLYGNINTTPYKMTIDLSLEIDEAKAIYDLFNEAVVGGLRQGLHGNVRDENRLLDQIRKILAKSGNSANPLDGMTNERARKGVYKIMAQFTRGIFKDQYWEPVNNIWTAFNAAGLDWTMMGSQYLHNNSGNSSGKEWKFEVKFINKNGRPTTMHGTVTASAAGTVEDPLSRYDLVGLVF